MTTSLRIPATRLVAMLACGAFLMFAASISRLCADGRVRLRGDELRHSRGGNQGKQQGSFKCDDLYNASNPNSQIPPCPSTGFGSACTTCSTAKYNDTSNTAGNYLVSTSKQLGGCGTIYKGVCLSTGVCNTFSKGNTGTACTDPPANQLTQQ